MNDFFDREVTKIRRAYDEICRLLADQPVTGKALLKAFSVLLPNMDAAEQKEKCDKLLYGMAKGEKKLERFIQLPENELLEEITASLRKGLKTLPQEMQRQYLMVLLQLIYKSAGCKIDGKVTSYLSSLPGELLEGEAVGLLRELGTVGLGEMARQFLELLEKEIDADFSGALDVAFSDLEKRMVKVAAVYVVCKQNEEYDAAEEFAGEYIGFVIDWMEKVQQAALGYTYSAAHNLIAIGAAAAGIYLFDQFMLSDELEKVFWTFGKKNYMEKLSVVGAASIAAFIDRSSDDLFYIQPFFMESIDNGERAADAVKEHYQKLWKNVHSDGTQKPVFEEEYVRVSEEIYTKI